MHNSIAQTFWKQNLVILLLFFLMDLWLQDIGKNGNFGGFWPFSQNVFNMVPWNLFYRHIVYTVRCVWKWLPWAKFSGPFWAKIGRFVGFRLFSRKDSTGFTWNLIYKLFGATFVGVCKIFLWPFWASKWIKNSGFRLFCQFFFSGFTSVLLYMFIGATSGDVYNMGLKRPFRAQT